MARCADRSGEAARSCGDTATASAKETLNDTAQLPNMPPHSSVTQLNKELRITPLVIEILGRRRRDHLFRPQPLFNQLGEPILERSEHLVLGVQIGVGHYGSISRDDARV